MNDNIIDKGFLIWKNFFEFLSGEDDYLVKKPEYTIKKERKEVCRELDFSDCPLLISGYATVGEDDQPLEPPLQSSQENFVPIAEQDYPMISPSASQN